MQKKRGRRPSPKRETQPSPNCQTPAGPWPSFSFLCARPIPGNPARLLLPSLPHPAQFHFPWPTLFPSWPGLPSPPARSAARVPPSHQRPRARLPATLTRPRCPTRAAPGPHALWPSPRTQPLPLPPQTARPALPPRAQPGRVTRAPLLSRACPHAPAHLSRSDGLLPKPRRPALASPARSVPDRPGPLVSSSARSRGRSRSIFPLSPTRRPHMAAPSPPRSNNRSRSAEIPGGPSIRGTTPQDQRSRFINGAPHP